MSQHEHDSHGGMHFSVNKVFGGLFLFTVLEVAWGVLGKKWGFNKPMLWGGLLFFAFLKGWLIAVYFMHLKFEGWVVKSLILPTPFLVMVIFGYVMPDVADDETRMKYPVGSEVNPTTGEVIQDMHDGWHPPGHGASAEGEAEHAPAGAEKH